MPFKSKLQARYLHAKEPGVAYKWRKKYGMPKDLPERKGSSKRALSGLQSARPR